MLLIRNLYHRILSNISSVDIYMFYKLLGKAEKYGHLLNRLEVLF